MLPHDSGEIDQFRAPTIAVAGIRKHAIVTLKDLETWVKARPPCAHHSLTCPICVGTERVSQAVSAFGCANIVPIR